MMSTNYWKTKLLKLQAQVISVNEESAEGRSTVELDQTSVGRLSRMDALQAQAMNNAIAARRKQQLSRIEAALERLTEDEFGYCIKCGEEIAEKRLELDPTTPTCTGCQ